MKMLAVIPARGGSKGIPGKNLHPLAGKPLIQYTIEAALAAKELDDVLLSSDDDDIIACARGLGLSVPYKRPAALAGDTTPMVAAVVDIIQWLKRERQVVPENIVLLQPTSPLRTAADIDAAVELYLERGTTSLMSVHPMTEHPCECVVSGEAGWDWLQAAAPGTACRQAYAQNYFFINGAIYINATRTLVAEQRFITTSTTEMHVMPPTRGIDIDDEFDLDKAAAILGRCRSRDAGAAG